MITLRDLQAEMDRLPPMEALAFLDEIAQHPEFATADRLEYVRRFLSCYAERTGLVYSDLRAAWICRWHRRASADHGLPDCPPQCLPDGPRRIRMLTPTEFELKAQARAVVDDFEAALYFQQTAYELRKWAMNLKRRPLRRRVLMR